MKMELTMSVQEAKKLAANALALVPIAGQILEVTEVEWRSYATEVVFTLTTPEPAIEPAPAGDTT